VEDFSHIYEKNVRGGGKTSGRGKRGLSDKGSTTRLGTVTTSRREGGNSVISKIIS